MSLQLLKAGTSDVLTLNGISKRAFDSDILVWGSSTGRTSRIYVSTISYENGKARSSVQVD